MATCQNPSIWIRGKQNTYKQLLFDSRTMAVTSKTIPVSEWSNRQDKKMPRDSRASRLANTRREEVKLVNAWLVQSRLKDGRFQKSEPLLMTWCRDLSFLMMCQYVQIRGFHIIVALVDSIGSVLNCVVLGERMCTYSVVTDCLHCTKYLTLFLTCKLLRIDST